MPRLTLALSAAAVILSAGICAAQYTQPERGSAERSAMLDAMRIHAEAELGAPVEFIVHELRMGESVGFGAVHAQRPGGGEIDVRTSPGYASGRLDPETMDGTSMQALLRRSGTQWVAVNWAIGATDAWFAYAPYCRRYRQVIADFCGAD